MEILAIQKSFLKINPQIIYQLVKWVLFINIGDDLKKSNDIFDF